MTALKETSSLQRKKRAPAESKRQTEGWLEVPTMDSEPKVSLKRPVKGHLKVASKKQAKGKQEIYRKHVSIILPLNGQLRAEGASKNLIKL